MGLFFIYSDCVVSEGVVEACGQGQHADGAEVGFIKLHKGLLRTVKELLKRGALWRKR